MQGDLEIDKEFKVDRYTHRHSFRLFL